LWSETEGRRERAKGSRVDASLCLPCSSAPRTIVSSSHRLRTHSKLAFRFRRMIFRPWWFSWSHGLSSRLAYCSLPHFILAESFASSKDGPYPFFAILLVIYLQHGEHVRLVLQRQLTSPHLLVRAFLARTRARLRTFSSPITYITLASSFTGDRVTRSEERISYLT
jgi:hypothetical protein